MASRNGPVLRLPGVTTLTVENPWERVNFCPERDANPFFHFMEAMAMLAGFNNAPFLAHFAKNMTAYSDDGQRFNAFYGERIRVSWGDQLRMAVEELRKDPLTRQAVVQIWDARDLGAVTKDKACNLCLLFSADPKNHSCLEMTSFNRSNDAIWGILTGANVVHLSFFHEYVAMAAGMRMGSWHHVSNNLHVYTNNPQWDKVKNAYPNDLYAMGVAPSQPLFERHITLPSLFDLGLHRFIDCCRQAIEDDALIDCVETPFFEQVATPIFNGWQLYKKGRLQDAIDFCSGITAEDWRFACSAWLERRQERRNSK